MTELVHQESSAGPEDPSPLPVLPDQVAAKFVTKPRKLVRASPQW
jgi:hypothetical protein